MLKWCANAAAPALRLSIVEAHMRTTSSKGVTRWSIVALTGLILTLARADAQQQPQPSAPNPYLMGTEGFNKGPRGLTSYQPTAIDQSRG
jgi:hypothetical protein